MTQQQDSNPDPSPLGSVSKRDYLRLLLAAMGVGAISTGSVETAKAAHLSDSPYPSGAWGYAPIASHGVSDRPSIAELNKAWSETYHFLNQDVDVGARYYAEKNDTEWDLLPIVWDGLDTPSDSDVPAAGVMVEQQESASAFRLLGIDNDASHRRVATVDWTETAFDQTVTLTFDTTAEHDGNIAEKGVHHEQPTSTDWAAADNVEKGYPTDWSRWSVPAPDHYWPLDEDTGTTANDVIGTADATITGATLGATGIFGTTSFAFDGVDDGVEDASVTDMVTSDPLSVSFWVKYNVQTDNFTGYFEHYDGSDGWRVYHDEGGSSTNNGAVAIATFGANTEKTGSDRETVNDGEWHHVVAIFDQPNDTTQVYVDGVLDQEVTSFTDNSATTSGQVRIGTDSGSNHFEGNIDEVMYWVGTALTASQVTELYEAAL